MSNQKSLWFARRILFYHFFYDTETWLHFGGDGGKKVSERVRETHSDNFPLWIYFQQRQV